MASSVFLNPGGVQLFSDGTSGAPSMAFASEPTLGFWRNGSGNITAQGTFTATSTIQSGARFILNGLSRLVSVATGDFNITNSGETIGVNIKVDALPTIASGFGAGAAITAGSTPLAGSINVGTTAGTGGVINFNGTAFPSAPFCVCQDDSSLLTIRGTTSTTQLTITAAALTNNDIISWICISSK